MTASMGMVHVTNLAPPGSECKPYAAGEIKSLRTALQTAKAEVGLYKLDAIDDLQLESAWFQPLRL
jgi:hypothetical protein